MRAYVRQQKKKWESEYNIMICSGIESNIHTNTKWENYDFAWVMESKPNY